MRHIYTYAFIACMGICACVMAGSVDGDKILLSTLSQQEAAGDMLGAIRTCTEILEHSLSLEDRCNVLLKRVYLESRIHERSAALEDVSEACRLNPKSALAWRSKGIILQGLGRFNESEESLSEAITLDNSDALSYEALGGEMRDRGNYDLAWTNYLRSLTLIGSDKVVSRRVHWECAELALDTGDYTLAYGRLRDAISLEPGNAGLYFMLGMAEFYLGKTNAAESEYSEGARIVGRSEGDQLAWKASCYVQVYQPELAIPLYRQALKLGCELRGIYSDYATACLMDNHPNEAGRLLDIAIEKGSTNSLTYEKRGLVRLMIGDYEDADVDFRKAIALNPEREDGHLGHGICLLLTERQEESTRAFVSGIAQCPHSARLWLWTKILNSADLPNPDDYYLQWSRRKWPFSLVRLYLGQITPEELLKDVNHPNPYETKERLSEALFFIGAKMVKSGRRDLARKYFDRCVRDTEPWNMASILARRELSKPYLEEIH